MTIYLPILSHILNQQLNVICAIINGPTQSALLVERTPSAESTL